MGRAAGSGTERSITLVFTDVAGSTAAWEAEPGPMAAAMAQHDAIVARQVAAGGGSLVKPRGEGDSCFLVFADPVAAVRTAGEIVREIEAAAWPTTQPIRIRVAIHTAQVEARDDDYYGPGVNRCARLRALAHPGQILLTRDCADLVVPHLGPREAMTVLGPHPLRDLADPELVHQYGADGLSPAFPPLRVAEADIRATTPMGSEWTEARFARAVGHPVAELELPDGGRVELTAKPAMIGRLPTCDVPLNDSSVSRAHARVTASPHGHVVVDLGSTNGVRVNDLEVSEQPLADGDRITLGSATLVYRVVSAP